MPEFPSVKGLTFGHGSVLSTATALLGLGVLAASDAAWPSANLAIFIPVRVATPVTICKIIVGAGATATGNFDVGIYDAAGNRLVSSGATAKGTNTEHVIDITDTTIGPGLYYIALSASTTNNYVRYVPGGTTPVPESMARLSGSLEMATAHPLPSTATFAARATGYLPAVALIPRGY